MRPAASCGRCVAGGKEFAAFCHVARKRGFVVSILLQVAFESVLAMIIVPYYITMSFDVPIMAAVVAIFAAIHCIAWRINGRPRCGTVENAKNT